ncbi:MAG: hypothetical protein NVS4B11_09370 [Ktedonobacteraceae bacterium]
MLDDPGHIASHNNLAVVLVVLRFPLFLLYKMNAQCIKHCYIDVRRVATKGLILLVKHTILGWF